MNVGFSASVYEKFINALYDDSPYSFLRKIASEKGVPSLEPAACSVLRSISACARPSRAVDIGCGIGVSSLAVLRGYPRARLTGIDGNTDRLEIFNDFFKNYENVDSFCAKAEDWLENTSEKYDLAFVDSVKREYASVWRRLRPKLNPGATAVFDDVLIYGYVACEEAEVPSKYAFLRREMISFLNGVFGDETVAAQLVPVSGGLLTVTLL